MTLVKICGVSEPRHARAAADVAADLKEGVRLAAQAVDSGAARDKLNAFVQLTRSFA